jgi:hypothetical protein
MYYNWLIYQSNIYIWFLLDEKSCNRNDYHRQEIVIMIPLILRVTNKLEKHAYSCTCEQPVKS